MSSINEQSIVSALKQLEFKKYDVEREDFIEVLAKDMVGILFPKETTKPVEEKKKRGGRKPKATATAEPAPAPAPAPAPTPEEQPKKKKPGPKPKAEGQPKPKKTSDTIKLNKVLKDRAKKIAEDVNVTWNKEEEKKLVTHLNTLGKEVYDSKAFEEHVKDFYAKKEEAKPETVEVDMEEREFEGKTYLVDPTTKRVYEEDSSGLPVPIGYVGMGKFEGLKML